jgi:hypothetical protein
MPEDGRPDLWPPVIYCTLNQHRMGANSSIARVQSCTEAQCGDVRQADLLRIEFILA